MKKDGVEEDGEASSLVAGDEADRGQDYLK